MSKNQHTLLAEQEARIVTYIQEGLTSIEIALREGMSVDEAGKKRKEIKAKHGVSSGKRKPVESLQYGLTHEASGSFRSRLGDHLYRLRLKHHPLEVALITGMTLAEQRRACVRPFNHDWTISQQERLAAALNIKMEDLRSAVTV